MPLRRVLCFRSINHNFTCNSIFLLSIGLMARLRRNSDLILNVDVAVSSYPSMTHRARHDDTQRAPLPEY